MARIEENSERERKRMTKSARECFEAKEGE